MNQAKFELGSQNTVVNTTKVEKKTRRTWFYVLVIIIILILLSSCLFLFSTSTFVVPNFLSLQPITNNDNGEGIAINGTPNQVIVRSDDAGQVTLFTPQPIATSSNPTFSGLTLSSLKNGNIQVEDGKLVIKALDLGNTSNVSGNLNISNGGTGINIAPQFNQVLVGDINGQYALRTLQAGNNITFTNTTDSLIINSTATGGGGGGAGDNCGTAECFVQNGNAFGTTGVLGTTDNNALRFITNNGERLNIGANGVVSIGTANPISVSGYGLTLQTAPTTNAADAGGVRTLINVNGTVAPGTIRAQRAEINYNSNQTIAGSLFGTSNVITLNSGGVNQAVGFTTSVTAANGVTTDTLRGNSATVTNNGTTTFLQGAAAFLTNNNTTSRFQGYSSSLTNNSIADTITGSLSIVTNQLAGSVTTSFGGYTSQPFNYGALERWDAFTAVGLNDATGTIANVMTQYFGDSTNDGVVTDAFVGMYAINRGSGSATDLVGFEYNELSAQTLSGGTYGIRLDSGSGNTVDNAYGISIQHVIDGAVNNYGLYIGDVSGGSTNNYSIYSAGGDAYFTNGLRVGNSSLTTAGNIRWTGTDFEGRTAGAWVSLTGGGGGCGGSCYTQSGNAFSATAVFGTTDDNAISFITNNTQKMILTNDGRLGVGASASAAYATLAAATTSNSSLNIVTSAGTNPSSPNSGDLWWTGTNLNFRTASTTIDLLAGDDCGSALCFVQSGNAFGASAVLGTTDSQDLYLKSNNIQSIRADVFGRVGLGETTNGPGGNLANYADVGIGSNTSPILTMEAIGNGVSYLATNSNISTILGAEHDLEFKTGVDFASGPIATGTVGLMIRQSDSYVGIGTSSPDALLHVSGDFTPSTGVGMLIEGTNSGGSLLSFTQTLVHSWAIGMYDAQDRFSIVNDRAPGNVGNEVLSILTGGNVGIGDSDPASLLTVGAGDVFQVDGTGAIVAATGVTSSGAITFSDLSGCGSGLQTDGGGVLSCLPSDVSLKKDVSTLSNALQQVNQLRGVAYNWKDSIKYGAQEEYGFIAQEVEQVAPDLVFTMGNGLKGVKYQQMTGLIVEAIKEQTVKINTLEDRVSSLELINSNNGIQSQQNGSNQNSNNLFTVNGSILTTDKAIQTTASITASTFNSIANQDFTINLNGISAFAIQDKDGAQVLGINQAGKITLKESQNGSLGKTKILAGSVSVVVSNTSVTENSKIFITPDQLVTFKVSEKIPGQSFKIEIESPLANDVNFDFFIIN